MNAMNISWGKSFFERRAKARLRCAMRGYRQLRDAKMLGNIARVKDAFVRSRLCVANEVSAHIFGAALSTAELSVRQYLLAQVSGLELGQALMSSFACRREGVALPLPAEWRKIVADLGFPIAPLQSKMAWVRYIAVKFFLGVALFLQRALACVPTIVRPANQSIGKFVYFDNLVLGALPQKVANGVSHDVLTWYASVTEKNEKFDAFCHSLENVGPRKLGDIEVVALSGPLVPLDRIGPFVKFLLWGMAASLQALVDGLRGRWVSALMLGEAVKAAHARLLSPDRLAREYLFHNSNCVYRPLWTYEAEKAGSKIVLYFYSTNCEPFKRPDGYAQFSGDFYGVMSWPNYLVWDTYQADFVRRESGDNAKIEVVGPIWFSSSPEDLPYLPAPAIAIFDVQPLRTSFYRRIGTDFDYYNQKNAIAFLADCYAAARACNVAVALKRKRDVGGLIHPTYETFIAKLAKQEKCFAINSSASATRVIERCAAVISMPFTSTALIGRALGKPSAYYDPFHMIQKDDRAGHGILILHGPEELRAWLCKVLNMEVVAQS